LLLAQGLEFQRWDIPMGLELEALGFYKSNEYRFPDERVDFLSTSFWEHYQTKFAERIKARDSENIHCGWLDNLEQAFTQPRRLFDGLPLGLYLAWEVGSLDRRFCTIIGQKMESVQEWFLEGNTSRKFAYNNPSTGNWLVFIYFRGNARQVQRELERLVRMKLIIEVNNNNFEYGVYGFGFQVSNIDPPQLMGMPCAEINGDSDILAGNFSQEEVSEASKIWGNRQSYEIKEFPD